MESDYIAVEPCKQQPEEASIRFSVRGLFSMAREFCCIPVN